MKAYEDGKPMYFATPPVNLIHAFNASLKTITKGNVSLEERFTMHKEQSSRIRKAVEELGLKQVAKNTGQQANGMTAVSVSVMPSITLLSIVIDLLPRGHGRYRCPAAAGCQRHHCSWGSSQGLQR